MWKYLQAYGELARIVQKISMSFTEGYGYAVNILPHLLYHWFSLYIHCFFSESCAFVPKNFCVFLVRTRIFSYYQPTGQMSNSGNKILIQYFNLPSMSFTLDLEQVFHLFLSIMALTFWEE